MPTEAKCPRQSQCLSPRKVAGFEVTLSGRFWVTPRRGHIWILGLMGLPRLDNTGRLEMLDASTQSPGTWLGPALTSLRGSGRMCRTLPELRERPGKATV
jgi:hypothetical protein